SLTQGAGEVNGYGALMLAYSANTSAAVGSPWISSPIDPHTTFGGEVTAWSQNVIWGTNILSGSGILRVNQQAWAQNIVWGELDNNYLVSSTSLSFGACSYLSSVGIY